MRIGFLGTGQMATALVNGLLANQAWPKEQITGLDIAKAARRNFTLATGVECTEPTAARAALNEIVVLAVKPQQAEAAAAILTDLPQPSLIISIAAGIPLASLEKWLGRERRLVRVMPNTPATIGQGVSVYACNREVNDQDRKNVERIFNAVGLVRELNEASLDAVTALSGSGPAYVFELIQGLTEAGIAVGLAPELALELTVHTVAGSAAMVERGIGSPEQLAKAVTSPGGTTEAGLAVMRKAGFRKILRETVTAARDRSSELGRKKQT